MRIPLTDDPFSVASGYDGDELPPDRVRLIERFGELIRPRDEAAPILSAQIRAAMMTWMTELDAAADLKPYNLEPRRRVMLVGPPGCGKTTIASHLAQRKALPLAVIDMGRINSKYVGETAENVSLLFRALRGYADRVILFFDEFDAIASKRAEGAKNHNQTIGTLLPMIEGYNGILIAASNFQDQIDQAIWRRFDMHLTVDLPTTAERFAILTRYFAPLVDRPLMEFLARHTEGAAPSLLRGVAEYLKRAIALAPRLKREIKTRMIVEEAVANQMPHPDMALPALWKRSDLLDALKDMPVPRLVVAA